MMKKGLNQAGYTEFEGFHGSTCPKCGDAGSTLETRMIPRSIGVVRRRKECQSCQERFTTLEVRIDELRDLMAAPEKYNQLVSLLDELQVRRQSI